MNEMQRQKPNTTHPDCRSCEPGAQLDLSKEIVGRTLDLPPTQVVDGLKYTPDYISLTKEADLIRLLDAQPWETVRRGGSECRVQRYGVVFDFKAGTVSDLNDIRPVPGFLRDLSVQLCAHGHFEVPPECFIINEYMPGQQLPPHIDVIEYWGPKVSTMSLLSAVEMDFIKADEKTVREHLILQPRSLLTIEGPARYEWKHGIKGRMTDVIDGETIPRSRRVSISCRNIKRDCFGEATLRRIDSSMDQ